MELFDLDVQKVVSCIEVTGDPITCLSLIPGQPYIMLGGSSGVLRVCCMTDSNMDPITQARPVIHLRLLNYRVSKHALGAQGKMQALSVCLSPCGPLALMLHTVTGVLVWNVRFSQAVCAVPNVSLDVLVSAKIMDPGSVTCVTWIGKLTSPDLFATGHESGDVFTWCLPEELRGLTDRSRVPTPQIMHRFVVRSEPSLGSSIQSISYISGSEDSLLVFGGQSLEEPAGLSLFPLASPSLEEKSEHVPLTARHLGLAWFGTILDFALVPPRGSMEHFDDPVGIFVLTEAGNLVMHDLQSQQPVPFSMPFQICQKQCSASLFVKLPDSSPLIAFLEEREEQSLHIMEEIGGVFDREHGWVLSGGRPGPQLPSGGRYPVLVLGYEDGSVRFWSLARAAPICPYAITGTGYLAQASVKTVEVLDEGTFLVTGDAKGQLCIFQMSSSARSVRVRKFSEPGEAPEVEEVEQEAGYQLLLYLALNTGPVQKIAFHPEAHWLAALDTTGGIALLNLITMETVFVSPSVLRGLHEIVDVTFCETAMISKDQEPFTEVFLFVTNAASSIVAVDPVSGSVVRDSDWIHPKNESKSVRLLALDTSYSAPALADIRLGGTEAFLWTPTNSTPEEEPPRSSPDATGGEVEKDEETKRDEPQAAAEETQGSEAGDRGRDLEAEEGQADILPERSGSPHHARFVSDDAETGALLAAALAKLDETSPDPQAKGRKVLSPWKRSQDTNRSTACGTPDAAESQELLHEPTHGACSLGGTASASASGPFLLLVTETYLRLYAPHTVLSGIRPPLHKISFPGRIAWAVPVVCTSPEAQERDGGLLVLAYDGTVHLFALPSLEILGTADLDEIVDFPLYKGGHSGEGSLTNLKLFEGDGEGGGYVCSQNGELVHFTCLQDPLMATPPQTQPTLEMYDWELAHAAHSASHLTHTGAPNANVSVTGERPVAAAAAPFKRGMDFFASWGRRARDEIDRAVRSSGRHEGASEGSSTLYEPPALDVLFCVHDHKAPPEIRAPLERQLSGPEPINVRSSLKKRVDDVKLPTSPVQRTAEEVRAKYGRGRTTHRTSDPGNAVSEIMTENVSKLHERGERLRTLNDRTEDLVNDAQSFAEMAKQLARHKSKKWWQF